MIGRSRVPVYPPGRPAPSSCRRGPGRLGEPARRALVPQPLFEPPRVVPVSPLDRPGQTVAQRPAAFPAEHGTSLTCVRHPPADALVTGPKCSAVQRRSRRLESGEFANDPDTSAMVLSRWLPMLKYSPSDSGELPGAPFRILRLDLGEAPGLAATVVNFRRQSVQRPVDAPADDVCGALPRTVNVEIPDNRRP